MLNFCNFTYSQPINADNLRSSWFATGTTSVTANANNSVVNTFMKTLSGSIRPLVCRYDSVVLNKTAALANGKAQLDNCSWELHTDIKPVTGQKDALDINFHFELKSGMATSSGVAVAFDFENWSADNYVLVPGAVYNGNRFRIYPDKYPPYIQDEKDKPLDMPITITNIPHFNQDLSPAKIELLTGNGSTPMMAFYDKQAKRGFILLTEQQTRFGNSGMIIEENLSKKQATFVLSAPGVREKRYVMCGFAQSGDKAADWKAGETVDLRMLVYNFPAVTLQDFFDRVFLVRKDLSGPTQYRTIRPFSNIAGIILNHHDQTKWFENDKTGYITQGYKGKGTNSPFPWNGIMQIGWAGIPVLSYPYLISPTDERIRRVSLSLDQLSKLQAPTGLTYAKFNEVPLGDNHANIRRPNQVLSRRFGEALYFGIQSMELMKQQGHTVKPEWETMFSKLADGIVTLWNNYGQFGQFVDVETGKIDVNNSSAGIVCASGLALASRYYKQPRYMEVAKKSAKFYYERDLSKGYSGGGAREMMQASDSESTYNMVLLYSTLYDMTGNEQWLNYSRNAASLLSTWMVSYRYNFPNESIMKRISADATGSVMASTQNNHSAPCLYIHSGDFMLKLFRATGDKRYACMLKDLTHNALQYTHTEANPIIKDGLPGSMSERVQISDWEGKETLGGGIPAGDSNMQWEVGTLLTILQNPGIYLNTDKNDLIVFDHVDAQIIKKDKIGLTLKITNNTAYDASVSIFAENNEQSKQPMGNYAFIKWPKVEVKANKTVEVLVTDNNELKIINKL
jgi:hypothetical protein